MQSWWFLIVINVTMRMAAIAIMVPANAMLSDKPDCVWCGWRVAEFVQKIEHPVGCGGGTGEVGVCPDVLFWFRGGFVFTDV